MLSGVIDEKHWHCDNFDCNTLLHSLDKKVPYNTMVFGIHMLCDTRSVRIIRKPIMAARRHCTAVVKAVQWMR